MGFFKQLPTFSPDSILGLSSLYKEDPRGDEKIDLLIGVFEHPYKRFGGCSAISKAMDLICKEEQNKLYLPIAGEQGYIDEIKALSFGGEFGAHPGIAACQSLGGTGALHLGASLYSEMKTSNKVFVSEQTWGNHKRIFSSQGFEVVSYPYYDETSHSIKEELLLDTIRKAPKHSVFIFQGCCHNPTGVDISHALWEKIAEVLQEGEHFPLIDLAYQGFGEGLEKDRQAVEVFFSHNLPVAVAACSSKNFCLYGERTGMFAIFCFERDNADRVEGFLKEKIRGEYSNPPRHGASIVNTIMRNPYLRQEWVDELNEMRSTLWGKRKWFADFLKKEGIEEFEFIRHQKGFFGYPAFSQQQVEFLREKWAIYTAPEGRFNVNGITEKNISKVVKGFLEAYALQ